MTGAQAIADAHAKVKMTQGKDVVSKSFVDTALTIYNRVLCVPGAEQLLVAMDERPKDRNPFSSVHRLQAILSKVNNGRAMFDLGVAEHPAHGRRGEDGCQRQ